jgi:hypothetical protein
MDQPAKKFRPYISWRTFLGLLEQMQERGLPARIDRSYLQNRSGAEQSYIMATLKSFALIDAEGQVLAALRSLVQNKDDRPAAVAAILNENYAEAVELAVNATHAQLDEVFRGYGLGGATARKAETFFLHAAAYAGLRMSPHFKTARLRGSTPGRRPARQRPRPEVPTPPMAAATDETPNMRRAYFDMLLAKAQGSDTVDTDLLDRMERLIGLEVQRPPD